MRKLTSYFVVLAAASTHLLNSDSNAYAQVSAVQSATEPLASLEARPITTFYQHLDVKRTPQFIVQGLRTGQQIHYQVISAFRIYAPDEDNYRRVVQKIENTRLVKADAMSQAVLTKSLNAMKGKTLRYKVTATGEVLSIDGHESNTEAMEIEQPKSKGMMISTVMDEDGWKELAQLTLFQPPETSPKKPFTRRTTHDWGSLGSWYGETQFKVATKSSKPKKYTYQHKLKYISPQKTQDDAATSIMGLSVRDAKFTMHKGSGEVLYDHKRDHVTGVRELFHARGTLATEMLGNPAKIAIDEKQVFTIKVSGYEATRAKESYSPSADRDLK